LKRIGIGWMPYFFSSLKIDKHWENYQWPSLYNWNKCQLVLSFKKNSPWMFINFLNYHKGYKYSTLKK
jgi:hypothetical protein